MSAASGKQGTEGGQGSKLGVPGVEGTGLVQPLGASPMFPVRNPKARWGCPGPLGNQPRSATNPAEGQADCRHSLPGGGGQALSSLPCILSFVLCPFLFLSCSLFFSALSFLAALLTHAFSFNPLALSWPWQHMEMGLGIPAPRAQPPSAPTPVTAMIHTGSNQPDLRFPYK